jgi:hypothetical protein
MGQQQVRRGGELMTHCEDQQKRRRLEMNDVIARVSQIKDSLGIISDILHFKVLSDYTFIDMKQMLNFKLFYLQQPPFQVMLGLLMGLLLNASISASSSG